RGGLRRVGVSGEEDRRYEQQKTQRTSQDLVHGGNLRSRLYGAQAAASNDRAPQRGLADVVPSHAQQAPAQVVLPAQHRRIAAPRDRAVVDDVGAFGQGQRQVRVLLDQQQRRLPLEGVQDVPHRLDDRRREPLEGLVEEQQLHVAHQRAADGQQLQPATRQRPTAGVAQLVQPGKRV